MALVQSNFNLKPHHDSPKTSYMTPIFQTPVRPSSRTSSSCINRDVINSSELEKLRVLGQGDHGSTAYEVHQKKNMKRKRDSNAAIYLNELSARFQNQPDKILGFKSVMADIVAHTDRDQSGRLKSIPDNTLERVVAIFEGHNDLLYQFNSFLPPWYQLSLDNDVNEDDDGEKEEIVVDALERKEPGLRDALDFFKKARALRGEKFYEAFLRTLVPLTNGSSSLDCVCKDAVALLADDPDLLEGFYRIFPVSKPTALACQLPDPQDLDMDSNRAGSLTADKKQKKHAGKIEVGEEKNMERKFVNRAGACAVKSGESVIEKLKSDGLSFFGKVKERMSSEFCYQRFLKVLCFYTKGKFGEGELENMVAAMIGKHSDLMDEFNSYMVKCKNIQELEARRCGRRDRKRANVEELDASKLVNRTPHYHLRSEDYPNPDKMYKGKHESKVLNYRSVSVALRNEDYPSKNKRREKIMFRCQDDRHEMDMLLIWFKSATEYAEEMEKGIDEGKITKGKRIHFLRCVERLYGDQGLEMLDVFEKNPQGALPVLKLRLKQKLEELKVGRDDLQKLWEEVQSRV